MEKRTLNDYSDGEAVSEDSIRVHQDSYKDKETLEKLYWEEGYSQYKISEMMGCSESTIYRWMSRHEIEKRSDDEAQLVKREEKEYADEDLLRKLHHEEKLPLYEIGEKFGVTGSCISYWMENFGIEVKDYHTKYDSFELGGHTPSWRGYPTIRVNGNNYIAEHQLVALAKGIPPEKIFKNTEYNIHHVNGMKCDNRPENLEIMKSSEHGRESLRLNQRSEEELYTFSEVKSLVQYMLNPTQYNTD